MRNFSTTNPALKLKRPFMTGYFTKTTFNARAVPLRKPISSAIIKVNYANSIVSAKHQPYHFFSLFPLKTKPSSSGKTAIRCTQLAFVYLKKKKKKSPHHLQWVLITNLFHMAPTTAHQLTSTQNPITCCFDTVVDFIS